MSLKRKINEIGDEMLHPNFTGVNLGLQGKTTKIDLEKAIDGYKQNRSEQSATNRLFAPIKKAIKHGVSCIDSGNTSYGAPANNTFSLDRKHITQPFEKWKACKCNWFPLSIITQRKERGGFVPGDLIFVIKNHSGEKHRTAGLFVSLVEINRAYQLWNNSDNKHTCDNHICPVCVPESRSGKFVQQLTANFHPVGIVMDEYYTPNQNNHYTIATDGEIQVRDYWRCLHLDTSKNQEFKLRNNRVLNPSRTNKMPHAAGESLFVGFSLQNDALYLQPVTGKTLECLLVDRDESWHATSFWAIGRIVNSGTGKQATKFNLTGIPSKNNQEIISTSPLYSQTFVTISLSVGLFLPEREE